MYSYILLNTIEKAIFRNTWMITTYILLFRSNKIFKKFCFRKMCTKWKHVMDDTRKTSFFWLILHVFKELNDYVISSISDDITELNYLSKTNSRRAFFTPFSVLRLGEHLLLKIINWRLILTPTDINYYYTIKYVLNNT
jgi:hypothetical protein